MHNKASHGDVYYIAASPSFRSRACWLALAGVALHFSGGWMLMALAENWQQNRQACCSAKAREIGVLLAAQLVTGAGFEIGVSRVGLSAESGFLAYLLF